MSEPRNARQLLELAERAAEGGDFSSADELLRELARLQEAEMGPSHPDLASTLNNLAVIAERTDRPDEAEAFYRRATAIVSAVLPADHPTVVESRRNLESFCRERGLPLVRTEAPPPPASRPSSRRFVWMAVGAIALITVAVFLLRPSTPPEPSTTSAQTAAAPTIAPAVEPPVAPAPSIVQEPPPAPAPPPPPAPPPSSVPSASTLTLTTAELCQTFSTSGGQWRCEPPGDAVAPGPIALYTRIKSSRDAAVVHRWYRDDVLRQAVTLTIRANPSEGYRTYSRQTVDGAGNWRVEVTDTAGSLLHERRFVVR